MMIAAHKKLLPLATLATTIRETSRYFLFDHLDNLCGWRNVKTGEEKISRTTADNIPRAFSGIHIIEPRLFSLIQQRGKFSIVDVYLSLARNEIIKSFDHSDTALVDVGKPESVVIAERLFK
jgi:NDP-sugar pyrophosphorylase family protein